MEFKTINHLVILLTLLVSFIPLPNIDEPLFIGCMVIIGLPHGALDHIAFLHGSPLPEKASTIFQKEKYKNYKFWKEFLGLYLGIMLAYSILWTIIPIQCLIFFILISIYHFGQSQLYYWTLKEESIVKTTLYLLWGAVALGQLVFFHYNESAVILASIVDLHSIISEPAGRYLVWITSFIYILYSSVLTFNKSLNRTDYFMELLGIASLASLSLQKSLLLGFTVYYGLWHSLKSMQVQCEELGLNMGSYILNALPFSVASIIGIIVILELVSYASNPYMLFFICLSVLTAPHMIVGMSMYTKRIFEKK